VVPLLRVPSPYATSEPSYERSGTNGYGASWRCGNIRVVSVVRFRIASSFTAGGRPSGEARQSATTLPSPLIAHADTDRSVIWLPSSFRLTMVVTPVLRSWTNASCSPSTSAGARLEATESNVTNRPLSLIDSGRVSSFAILPSVATLTTWVEPCKLSRTNTCLVEGAMAR
jgi:hypothetical protein